MRKSWFFLMLLFLCFSLQQDISYLIVDPTHCVTPQRFDVLAKYIYAKHFSKKINSNWATDLYSRHLIVWNPSLQETDGINIYKEGIRDYLYSFHKLIGSLSNEAFNSQLSVVPLHLPTYNLLDGAHRAGCCLYAKKSLICDTSPLRSQFNITADYFRSVGLEEKYLDAMALEYVFLKKNTYFVNLFPVAQGYDNEIEAILSKKTKIIYKKNIFLKNNGPFLFMKSLYEGQEWIGSKEDGYKAADDKVAICFSKEFLDKPVKIYLIEADSFQDILLVKKKIRDFFGIDHYSVHINDTHKEAREEAKIVFNQNSIHLLNHRPKEDFPHFSDFLLSYRRWLKRNCLNEEDFCIDGSSILAAYGIREAADLDFLYHGNPQILPVCEDCFDEHSAELRYHVTTKDDIIFNPDNHFYYKGVKFASLDIIKNMKRIRAEIPKDINDIQLISSHIKQFHSVGDSPK